MLFIQRLGIKEGGVIIRSSLGVKFRRVKSGQDIHGILGEDIIITYIAI